MKTEFSTNRRALLGGASAVVAATLLPISAVRPAKAAERPLTLIDVHRHYSVPAVAEAATAAGQPAGTMTRTLDALLADMDKGGVKIGVLSTGTEAPFKNPATQAATCRKLNDDMAKTRADHPGRFGIFANIPAPNIDASLKEIEYAFDTLKVDGVHMFSNIGGKWFGDPALGPIFAELNRRKAVIKTHPAVPECCNFKPLEPYGGAGVVELGTDSLRAITMTLFSGTAAKYPDMKIIWSHLGGSLTSMAERFYYEYDTNPKKWEAVLPQGVTHELRKMYYDTAQAYSPVTLQGIKDLAGVDQVMFGTDYAFRTAKETIDAIEASHVFNAAELAAIGSGNARKLMPNLPA
jgi:predicted TIM-barrel fold metal-dependent hydrolase